MINMSSSTYILNDNAHGTRSLGRYYLAEIKYLVILFDTFVIHE